MRVLLADDHALLLEGLQNLLEAHGVDVVGAAKNGQEAAAQARILHPDVILMDIRMPVLDGLAATRLIKSEMPEIKIVILTTSTEDEDLFEAVKSGATGYLLKSMDADGLVQALEDAQQDVPPFAPGLGIKLLTEFAQRAEKMEVVAPARADGATTAGSQAAGPLVPLDAATLGAGAAATTPTLSAAGLVIPSTLASPEDTLSFRQAEVLTLIAQGLSYKEIGLRVCLSPRTIKYHMAEIMRKLHAENRAQVLAYAGSAITRGRKGDCD
jgi:DNA-binding NarL/FixJ family response regulator